MKKLVIPLLPCLLLLFSSSLWAQNVLLITSETLDKEAKATSSRMYLSKNKVLIETEDENHPMSTLFDADKEEIYLIDHKKKEYFIMTKADMAAMHAQLQSAMQQMEQQLKQLPESQRKMVEEQMKKVQGLQDPLQYRRVATNIAVKGWKSSHYEGKSGDKLRHEVYVASYGELGEDKENFRALLTFYTLMQDQLQQMSKSMPALLNFSAPKLPDSKEGLPVKSVYYDEKGNPEITSLLTAIEQAALPEEKWQVPGRYKQKKFPGTGK